MMESPSYALALTSLDSSRLITFQWIVVGDQLLGGPLSS